MRVESVTQVWWAGLESSEEQDEPLAGQEHRLAIDTSFLPLYARWRGPACFVAAELRVYRDPANRNDWREPDIMVALDVPDRRRERYLLWEERKAPDLVIEVLSDSSLKNGDLDDKRDWYRREGVREYVVLDPSGKFPSQPHLQAWRFSDLARPGLGGLEHEVAPAGALLKSRVIEVGWIVQGQDIRLVDLMTRGLLPLPWELDDALRAEIAGRQEAQAQALLAEARAQTELEARQQAVERAQEAEARAHQAEERAERQHAELERLRRELGG